MARRVSIIEDDASLCLALVGLVHSLGYEASGFQSAEDFLQSAQLEQAECVITDVHMPQMNGIDLKKQLNERGNLVPVILITARSERALEKMAIEIGAFGLITKPFDMDELVECLQKAMAS